MPTYLEAINCFLEETMGADHSSVVDKSGAIHPEANHPTIDSADRHSFTPIPIANITEPSVLRYFDTLNAKDFQATSALFAEDGIMQPPFESRIIGRAAIATYLDAEARDLSLRPQRGQATLLEDGYTHVQIVGNVQTSWFGVNVQWNFVLNAEGLIAFVEIKLLASLQELLKLKR